MQPLKWHGGKSKLADWLHSLAPPKKSYTHRNIPYFGGGGEFWNWDFDGVSEAVNDINGDLQNFYRALQSDNFHELYRRLRVTLLSQVTWEHCKELCSYFRYMRDDTETPIESPLTPLQLSQAVWFFIKYRQSRQGLGKDYCTPTKRTRRGMNENVSAWLSAIDGLEECHERLQRVELRCMPAVDFIKQYDHPKAFFYVDPPYLHETRVTRADYEFEMSGEDHVKLLDCLAQIKGKFLLSGYWSEMYENYKKLHGWFDDMTLVSCASSSTGRKEDRTEFVWANYALRKT